jgi:hypothetical protein
MSWVKLDDRAFNDQRFGRCSRDARLLHIEALAWSMAGDGTGAITPYGLRKATDAAEPETLAAELVAQGIWTATDDGWQVVFMLDDQLSPEEIARQREWNRAKQARHRRHLRGDHSECDPRFCNAARGNPVRNPVTYPVTNGVTHAPRPDPTKGGSREEGARSARSGLRPPLAALASSESRARGRKWTDEQRAAHAEKVRAAHARRREEREAREAASAEEAARADEEREARAVEAQARRDAEWVELGGDPEAVPVSERQIAQQRMDAEWLSLGGSPNVLPVSHERLYRKKNGGRRPLR